MVIPNEFDVSASGLTIHLQNEDVKTQQVSRVKFVDASLSPGIVERTYIVSIAQSKDLRTVDLFISRGMVVPLAVPVSDSTGFNVDQWKRCKLIVFRAPDYIKLFSFSGEYTLELSFSMAKYFKVVPMDIARAIQGLRGLLEDPEFSFNTYVFPARCV